MTKCRQTPAIAEYPRAPRPVAVLRESAAAYSGTPCLRRRGRESPSCRDDPRSSSPWYRPGGSCRPQAVRGPWRCRATKAFAATAARTGPVEAWNLTRKLKTLSSFQVSLPNATDARKAAAKEYHRRGRHAPQIDKPQTLHKSCRDPGEGPANLEVAICNLKLVEGIGSAGMEGEECGFSLPGATIAMRSQAEFLPRQSWWGNFPYSRRSSK